jgi:hypothetical protein
MLLSSLWLLIPAAAAPVFAVECLIMEARDR